MGMKLGLWRIDDGIEAVELGEMPSEEQLEELLEKYPSVLGEKLLIIGRQVGTSSGKRIDLLAMDSDGALRVLELKKGRAARDAVSQILDYGAWVASLSHSRVLDIFDQKHDFPFEEAFENTFGFPAPEELNTGHKLTLVTTAVDEDAERIIDYLDSNYGVPINAVFFRYFRDGDHEYLARNYLIEESQEPVQKTRQGSNTREHWNGFDWYVAFDRPWADARRLGYVSAGGGDWYATTLQKVPEGARVWVYVPKTGYVGVGIATGPATRFEDSHIADAKDLEWDMNHANGEPEWVLPVRWISTVPLEEAVWKKGMFANQNSACRLRNSFTLENLYAAFGVDDSTASGIEAVSTVDDHREQIDDPGLQAAFDAIIDQTTALSPEVTIVPRKFYIAFKRGRNFACLEVQKKKLLVFLHLDPADFITNPVLGARDVRNVGHFGTGDVEIQVTGPADVDQAMALIRRAYGEEE